MKFSKILGDSEDPKLQALVKQAEQKLSDTMLELSLSYTNKSFGSSIGGDPLVYLLVACSPHICDASAYHFDELKAKEKEFDRKVAAGEPVDEKDRISDELRAFRKKMGNKMLRTAATNGSTFYWNPEFVVKQDRMGLRIIFSHEALHAIYMQPSRRGSRIPRLWNIAIDYKVNFTVIEDFRARDIADPVKMFKDHLGDFIEIEEYKSLLRDPFHPPARLTKFGALEGLKKMLDPAYKIPGSDDAPMYYAAANLANDMRKPEVIYDDLLACIPKCPKCGKLGKYKKPDEYKALEKQLKDKQKKEAAAKNKKDKKNGKTGKSDPHKGHKHAEEKDENCPIHGSQEAKDKAAKEAKEREEKEKQVASGNPEKDGNKDKSGGDAPGDESGHQHGTGQDCTCPDAGHGKGDAAGDDKSEGGEGDEHQCDAGKGGCGEQGDCDECGGDGDGEGDYEYIDPFGNGDTLDDHMDTDISEEELAKRIHDAINTASKLGGKIPGGMEDELGMLVKPRLTWQDFLRSRILKTRQGFGKNDWTRPKSRPLFAGLYSPKKRDHFVHVLAAYDTSGSMSTEDIAFGISQLQVIDERGELDCVSWDSKVYWETMIKLKKGTVDELKKLRVCGRGGTVCGDVFNQYEEHCGKVDIIVIMTDGFLADGELSNVKVPDKDVQVLLAHYLTQSQFQAEIWTRVSLVEREYERIALDKGITHPYIERMSNACINCGNTGSLAKTLCERCNRRKQVWGTPNPTYKCDVPGTMSDRQITIL